MSTATMSVHAPLGATARPFCSCDACDGARVTRRAGLLRALLASRNLRCDPSCPGWFVNSERAEIQVCDECSFANGLDVDDDDVAELPEAQSALAEEWPDDEDYDRSA